MKVHCRTNLDLDRAEDWPDELLAIPCRGDRIQSAMIWNDDFQLQLEVMAVIWKQNQYTNEWIPEIELHIPIGFHKSITDFYKWYAPKVGRSVSSFI